MYVEIRKQSYLIYLAIKKIVLIVCVFFACTTKQQLYTQLTCIPEITGFYPSTQEAMQTALEQYFTKAYTTFRVPGNPNAIRALIVPHAGWHYSGLCAAATYGALLRNNDTKNTMYNRVILLAPSHYTPYWGVALPHCTTYETPLGTVPIDVEAVHKLARQDFFTYDTTNMYQQEHAVAVQVPFLQHTLESWKLIPLIVGTADTATIRSIARALHTIIDERTLVVVSSDFTHYGKAYNFEPWPPHQHYGKNLLYNLDMGAVENFMTLDQEAIQKYITTTQATICGITPIRICMALLTLATHAPLKTRLAAYYQSPDIVSQKARDSASVSYTGIVITTDEHAAQELTQYEQEMLIQYARDVLIQLYDPEYPVRQPPLLPVYQQKRGVFVTLKNSDDSLRGCIGTVQATESILGLTRSMALAAALHDSRFTPVTQAELPSLAIEISILTKPTTITDYTDIRAGTDGVILHKLDTAGREIASALFLPNVAEEFGWDREHMLQELSKKAGLDANAWQHDCRFETFQSILVKASPAKD